MPVPDFLRMVRARIQHRLETYDQLTPQAQEQLLYTMAFYSLYTHADEFKIQERPT